MNLIREILLNNRFVIYVHHFSHLILILSYVHLINVHSHFISIFIIDDNTYAQTHTHTHLCAEVSKDGWDGEKEREGNEERERGGGGGGGKE